MGQPGFAQLAHYFQKGCRYCLRPFPPPPRGFPPPPDCLTVPEPPPDPDLATLPDDDGLLGAERIEGRENSTFPPLDLRSTDLCGAEYTGALGLGALRNSLDEGRLLPFDLDRCGGAV